MESTGNGAAVRIEHVTKRYGRMRAVDDISLQVHPGELFAFLGPNGAGKTTTIKMLTGLLTPDEGKIEICGHPITTDAVAAKRKLAYVPDQPFLYEKLSAREFLHFVAQMYSLEPEVTKRRMNALMQLLGISEYADQMAEGYSHGMKQKVMLAAAMIHEPDVLIVDEPMVGLDPSGMRIVKEQFRAWARAGRTVFMSTHTLDIAEAIADRIAIIHHGRIIACGTLAELRARAEREHRLEDIFLELTRPDGAAREARFDDTGQAAGPPATMADVPNSHNEPT